MRSKPDHDEKHATTDGLGNVTAKNQDGIDAKGRPRKRKPKPSADGLGLGITT